MAGISVTGNKKIATLMKDFNEQFPYIRLGIFYSYARDAVKKGQSITNIPGDKTYLHCRQQENQLPGERVRHRIRPLLPGVLHRQEGRPLLHLRLRRRQDPRLLQRRVQEERLQEGRVEVVCFKIIQPSYKFGH